MTSRLAPPASRGARSTTRTSARPPVRAAAGSGNDTRTAGRRSPVIDNARFVLIGLVVLGHLLTTMRAQPTVGTVYTWVYMFHMPAFVFLAGLVVRGDAVGPPQGSRIASGLLAPLVIFGALYAAASWAFGFDGPATDSLMDPYWILWFLVALAMWRLSVPVLRALRWPITTTVLLAAVLVLLTDLPPILSLDRFIVLLPFFTAGLVLEPSQLERIRTVPGRLTALAILAVSTLLVRSVSVLPSGFLSFADRVDTSGRELPELGAHLAMYGIAAAMIAAVLALVPGGRGRIAVWGSRSMYVYLLHGFVVLAFRASPLDAWTVGPLGWVLLVLMSFALAAILASDRCVRLARPLVEPDIRWALRAAPGGSSSG